jgi:hypothetical protein
MVFKALVVVVYFICLFNTDQAWLTINKDYNNWEVAGYPTACKMQFSIF